MPASTFRPRRGAGPSSDARAKAIAAKRARQRRRLDELRRLLLEIEVKLTAGTLRPDEVTHEFIYGQAGLSHATYWRYLKADDELRVKATVLARRSSRRLQEEGADDRLMSPLQAEDTQTVMLERLEEENLEMARVIDNLQRQLAAAKTLVSVIDADLRAKTQEVQSKDFLLGAERETNLKVVAKLKDVVELCRSSGLAVDIELSAYLAPRSAPRGAAPVPAAVRRKRTKLTVIERKEDP
jgi:hypothetical protein